MSTALNIADLKSRALIAVGGEDWRDWLQGLITQDVATLKAGEIRYGALLSPQGRLLFDLFVIGAAEGCRLDVAAQGREALMGRLKLYRLRSKVTLAEDETPVLAAWGGRAGPDWLPDPRLPQLGWRGYGPLAVPNAAEADYEAHRLGLGVPGTDDFGADATYAVEADFDLLHGVDFKKGCFVGQEITSRMKRRGEIKTRMAPIVFDGPPPAPGAEILKGELRAGTVLSGRNGRAMALLRLDRAHGDLTCEGRPVSVCWPAWMTPPA